MLSSTFNVCAMGRPGSAGRFASWGYCKAARHAKLMRRNFLLALMLSIAAALPALAFVVRPATLPRIVCPHPTHFLLAKPESSPAYGHCRDGHSVWLEVTCAPMLALLTNASPAVAASAVTDSFAQLPSAIVAYGHYLALLLCTGALAVERLSLKEGMTREDEERLASADLVYVFAALLVVLTGYLRTTDYGKGWDFYQHEPIFWVKLILVAVAGASSLFPTIKLFQRSNARNKESSEEFVPMSPKLVARMTSIINAELLAIFSIPLAATLMARGVGYLDWLPWQAGAALTLFAFGGLGVKYGKEALDWTEEVSD